MAIPQDGIKISELTSASFNPNSLMPLAVPDPNAITGYTNGQESLNAVGEGIVSSIAYTASALRTTAKTIIGAINEAYGIRLSGTLTAGSTTLTLSDAGILGDGQTYIWCTSVLGVNPTNVVPAVGSVTFTFEAQASDLGVEVIVL